MRDRPALNGWAVAAFGLLVAATIAAFFVTQRLKRSEPVVLGVRRIAAFSPVSPFPARRLTRVSFYLRRGDDVTVDVVDARGDEVRSLAAGQHVPRRTRVGWTWDGRDASGRRAPDGIYLFRVGLARQGRSLTLPFPVRLATRPPRPLVVRVAPAHGSGPLILPSGGSRHAIAVLSGTHGRRSRALVFRTDVTPARVVRRFPVPAGRRSYVWDGRLDGGAPAPPGVYLLGLYIVDRAGNPGTFPARLPPVPTGSRARPGVTVRALAATAPLAPAAAGAPLGVRVLASSPRYLFALRREGAGAPVARGAGRPGLLRLRAPRAAGLYVLALRAGRARESVPIVVRGPARRVAVVVPTLQMQAGNPVDDDGDGIPNLLSNGGPVDLRRPFARTPPTLPGAVLPVLRALDAERLPYELTTDAALAAPAGTALAGRSGVALPAAETWATPQLAAALRGFTSAGGGVLRLAPDDLRRSARLARAALRDPGPPAAADALGGRPAKALRGPVDVLAYQDAIGLFGGTGGGFGTWPAAVPLAGTDPGQPLAAAAGPSDGVPVIAAWRRGRGLVIRTGLPGFAGRLPGDLELRALLRRAWAILRAGA